jgi:NitT/TauT family transport system ATP-binding protein
MDIIVQDLTKAYGDKVVFKNFNVTFKSAMTICIMAQSGYGKTTLLSILMGIDKNYSGKIRGLENKKVSAVFQEDRLCENISPLSNIGLVCASYITKEEMIYALTQVGLSACINQPTRCLSGGMKRRVVLLRALLAEFDILFLDEPFKGLDQTTKDTMLQFTKEKIKGKTVVMVTHDMQEALLMEGEIIHLSM